MKTRPFIFSLGQFQPVSQIVIVSLAATLACPHIENGEGFGNRFAIQFGIFAIPTVWLVDKHGNLRDTIARGPDLEHRIERLLDEQASPR